MNPDEHSNLPGKFENCGSQIQAMESRFLYFYPRNRHRGFDPVNVTNKLEQICCGIFLTVSWPLNLRCKRNELFYQLTVILMIKFIFIFLLFIQPASSFACSIIAVHNEEENLVGRNFDYPADEEFVCFYPASHDNYSFVAFNQYGSDMPYDGMNSKGLFIGIAAISDGNTDTGSSWLNPWVTSLGILVRVLEKAATVDEAIQVFNSYKIHFGQFLGFPPLQYLIADNQNNRVVIAPWNGQMQVVKSKHSYQILTNFNPLSFDLQNLPLRFYRYQLAEKMVNQEIVTSDLVARILNQVHPITEDLFWGEKILDNRIYTGKEILITLFGKVPEGDWAEGIKLGDRYSKTKALSILNQGIEPYRDNFSLTLWSNVYNLDKRNIIIYLRSDFEHMYVIDPKKHWKQDFCLPMTYKTLEQLQK